MSIEVKTDTNSDELFTSSRLGVAWENIGQILDLDRKHEGLDPDWAPGQLEAFYEFVDTNRPVVD